MTIIRSSMTIEDYLRLEWNPQTAIDPDGGYVLTIWPLNDFAVYGDSEAEVLAEWQSALRSHLTGYLKVGKAIPTGRLDVAVSGSTGSFAEQSDELTFA